MGLFRKSLSACMPEEVREAVQRDLDEDMARAEAEFEESMRSIPSMQEIVAHPERLSTAADYKREQRAKRIHHTNEERLAYYRARGLGRCDDYPGGDAQFEADVLSGAYHDEDGDMDDVPREDAYVISKMLDGTFLFERMFRQYGYSNRVMAAYNKVYYELGRARFFDRK